MDEHPIQGGVEILTSHLMLQKPQMGTTGLTGYWAQINCRLDLIIMDACCHGTIVLVHNETGK